MHHQIIHLPNQVIVILNVKPNAGTFFIMQVSVPQKLLHTQWRVVRMTLIRANTSNETVKQKWIQKRESLIMTVDF